MLKFFRLGTIHWKRNLFGFKIAHIYVFTNLRNRMYSVIARIYLFYLNVLEPLVELMPDGAKKFANANRKAFSETNRF